MHLKKITLVKFVMAIAMTFSLVALSACSGSEEVDHFAQAKAQSLTVDDVSGQVGATFDNYEYFKETRWFLKKHPDGKMEIVAEGVTDLSKYFGLEMNKKEVTERMLNQMIKKMPGIEIVTRAVFPIGAEGKVSNPTVTVDVVMPDPSQISTNTFADEENATYKSILENKHSDLILGIIIGS